MKFLTKGEIYCVSRSSLGTFTIRGHSFVELTKHDNTAADIMVQSVYIYTYILLNSWSGRPGDSVGNLETL